jgi:hypothetical protein
MLEERLQRRISGSADSDMELKDSSVYKRKQKPGPLYPGQLQLAYASTPIRTSRPARPARCIADDFVISRVNKVSNPAVYTVLQSLYTISIELGLTTTWIPGEKTFLFTFPSINYILNPWYRDRRLRNISGQNTFAGVRGRR